MSSRHLCQYKRKFYVVDEVLIANLPPTKAPGKRMHFQIKNKESGNYSERVTTSSILLQVYVPQKSMVPQNIHRY